jgi:asparagine synthase (glutamine-hydrolysing)
MLRFDLHCDDVAAQWRWQDSCWRSGSSWIAPVRSPALRLESRLDRDATVAVREIRPGGDFTELTLGADRVVALTAGPLGVAPLYLATCGERLIGSWDPADLASFAEPDDLSPAVLTRLLTRRHRYSAATLFSRITRLTAGATLQWSRTSGLRLRYPAPVRHISKPRRLRPGAEPVAHFAKLMNQVVHDAFDGLRGTVAVELSGGLDSASVALSAASLPIASLSAGQVLSGGLIVAGRAGLDQEIRRRIIVNHLGLRDITVPANDHLPLSPGGSRTVDRTHYPDTDVYQEAFDALRGRLRAAGARFVLTGYGGDEIMSRTPAERPRPTTPPRLPPWLDQRARDALADVDADCSPVTAVALPTLVVFAARHPAYLRAGLWPVAPFTASELSRFGRSLPVEWRTGKELLRQRLARTGLPTTVTHPQRPESFAATMNRALRRHAPALLADMLERSLLIDRGFVRRTAVEHLHRRARDGGMMPPLVYDMLALDIGIRSMCTDATAGREGSWASSTPDL